MTSWLLPGSGLLVEGNYLVLGEVLDALSLTHLALITCTKLCEIVRLFKAQHHPRGGGVP